MSCTVNTIAAAVIEAAPPVFSTSAGVTLLHGDLRGVDRALQLGRATLANIRQNLAFAFAYNLLGVPLADGVLVKGIEIIY